MKTTRFLIVAVFLSARLVTAQETVLHSFTVPPTTDGFEPWDTLIQGSDGKFYGTTQYGGVNDGGSVFQVDSAGTEMVIHSFGVNASPVAALFQASDGLYYGTTVTGGTHNMGSVFHLDSVGNFSTLHSFDGTDGAYPYGSVIEGADGNFYGTTDGGGANDTGTVFQMTPSGTVTTLHSFGAGFSGGPSAGLVLGSDGLFYGTAEFGGGHNDGSVFKISSAGDYTQLHAFDGSDGENPNAPLLQASDGNFYGTTTYGGDHNGGVIFKVDSDGNFSVLAHLPHLANPNAGLIELADGRLYGTILGAGAHGKGAVLKINRSTGEYSTPFSFSGSDGWEPVGGLVQGTDGALYGTTITGGDAGGGVVYSLCTPLPSPSIDVTSCLPPNTPGLTASVSNVAGNTYNWTLTGGTLASGQGTSAITFTSGPAGTHMVISVDQSNGTCLGSDQQAAEADFADVPPSDPFHDYICTIARDQITAGCGSGDYCRSSAVTRAQMAVFLLKSMFGINFVPAACTGVFADVPCPSQFADWIEQLANQLITSGCGNGDYCPDAPVTRRQMAVFLLKASVSNAYTPPPAVGIFGDVPASDPFAPWIEDLYHRGITGGCQVSPLLYCPDNPNTRGQMAVFLTKTFGL